jgi:hypothetical protein
MIDRAIGIAGIGIGIISAVLLVVFPRLNPKVGFAGMVVGVLLLGAAGVIAFLPDGNAQSPPVVNQGPGSAYSVGQQGGITAGTLNVGSVPRRLPQSQAATLASALALRNISGIIEVQSDLMGCLDCDSFAKQLEELLRSSPALKIVPIRNGMTMLPFRGVALGVRDKNNVPASAQAIVDAFRAAGGNLFIVEVPPNNPDSDAVLIIALPTM